jgi:DNA-binding response OmpR family regulator
MGSVRMFVNDVLLDAGYRCTLAEDADSALRLLGADDSINIMLTDVGLPQMNGRDLADAARLARPGLPILFMTGYAENALNLQTFLQERMDMVVKPFRIDDLLARISSLLNPSE